MNYSRVIRVTPGQPTIGMATFTTRVDRPQRLADVSTETLKREIKRREEKR